MTSVLSLVERRVFDHIHQAEIGIEYGRAHGGRVQSFYQPIFAVGARGQLKLSALRAGCVLGGRVEDAAAIAPVVAAPLALRNFGYSGEEELDLYLDQSIAGNWTSGELMQCCGEGRPLDGLLPQPRRIFLEFSPQAKHMPAPQGGQFRRALVNEKPEDELDAWIGRFRPSILRVEGKWLASLSRHAATRTLLATLTGALRRRGVKTLFEGLDNDALVELAMDCCADLVQGMTLARPILAGEDIDVRSINIRSEVISVDFKGRRKPSLV